MASNSHSLRFLAGMAQQGHQLKVFSPSLSQQSGHKPEGAGAGSPGAELCQLRPADAEGGAGGTQHLRGSVPGHRVSEQCFAEALRAAECVHIQDATPHWCSGPGSATGVKG